MKEYKIQRIKNNKDIINKDKRLTIFNYLNEKKGNNDRNVNESNLIK